MIVPGEQCRICGGMVPFSETAHVMLNPRDGTGIVDYYVCRSCYEAELATLFADPDPAGED